MNRFRQSSLWRNRDRLGAICILILSLTYLRLTLLLPVDQLAANTGITARTWPFLLGIAGTVCSVLLFLLSPGNQSSDGTDSASTSQGIHWGPTGGLVALMLVYVVIFDWLGFLLASCVFLLGAILLLGERRWVPAVAVSVGLPGFMWVLLTQVFGVYLDSGELYRLIAGVFG